MADKYVFIVTGLNDGTPSFFTSIAAISAMNEVRALSKNKRRSTSRITTPSTVQFIHFNFEKNIVRFYKHSFDTKGNDPFGAGIQKKPDSMWTETDPPAFIKRHTNLTIVDLYHSVRSAPPQSVLDVHLYSHGFIDGPVLVNSDDKLEGTAGDHFEPSMLPKRDPNDRDGRVRTDFAPNMGEDPNVVGQGKAFEGGGTALAEFLSKFAPGGTFRVYGCNIQDRAKLNGEIEYVRSTPFQIIHEVFDKPIQDSTSPLGRALRADRHAKPTNVTIRLDRACAIEKGLKDPHHPTEPLTKLSIPELIAVHGATDSVFFGGTTTGVITRNYDDIVKYIARQTQSIYVFAAAEALPGVTCYGAVPGTSGDKEKPEGGDRTMIVKGYGRYLNFYNRYLDIDTKDPDAVRPLHYGRFDTATVAKVKAHATGG